MPHYYYLAEDGTRHDLDLAEVVVPGDVLELELPATHLLFRRSLLTCVESLMLDTQGLVLKKLDVVHGKVTQVTAPR